MRSGPSLASVHLEIMTRDHSPGILCFLLLESILVGTFLLLGNFPWIAASLAFVIWSLGITINHFPLPSKSTPRSRILRPGFFLKNSLQQSVLPIAALLSLSLLAFSVPRLFGAHTAIVPALVPVALLLAGGILAFLEIYRSLTDRSEAAASPRLAAQLGHWRLLAVLHLLAAAVLFVEVYRQTPYHQFIALALAALTLLSIAETLLRAIARLYVPRRLWYRSAPLGSFFFTKYWGAPYNAAFPKSAEFEDAFALQLPEMWMWPTVRRALLPMFACVGSMAWLASGLHEIQPGEKGILRTFGAMTEKPLAPGLHLTLPLPFGSVDRVSTERIETLTLGFASDPGEPILWEKSHYIGEEHVLVGGGDDFLAISVPILYRIADPVAHAKHMLGSAEWLASLARRSLLQEAIRLSSFEIMTTRREELRALLKKDLQSALDERQSGIEIVEVYLRDIHPPVEAAAAFQEVMAAMEDREAQIHVAEAQVNETLPRSKATAYQTTLEADQKSSSRILRAQGQTARFSMLATAYRMEPEIYRIRESFLAIDETLSGAKKIVMDTRFQNEMPAYVDLRKVLNPDFIDGSLPEAQTLVPDIAGFRSTFDMEVEGFLQRGKGEMPAVDMSVPDPDLNETK